MSLIIGFILLALLYFLPSVIAFSRKHFNSASIFVLNLFLGWTFIGWIVALVWAVGNSAHKKKNDE